MRLKTILVFLFVVVSISYSGILVQPYLLVDADSPGTGVHVRWKSTADATVIYGVLAEGTLDSTAQGDSFGVHLTNLQPGVRYAYRVICEGDTSIAGSFLTSPPSGTSVVIALTSDTQKVDKNAADTFREMFVNFHPDLLVIVGDVIWSDGSTTCASNPNRATCSYDSMFSHTPEVFANTILVPVKGNHDGTDQYIETFSVLPDSGRYYTFKYGSTAFLAIHSGLYLNSQPAYTKFKDTYTMFKIGMDHEPTYGLTGTTNNMKTAYYCGTAGCQLVLNGHMHYYVRTNWIKNPATSNGLYPADVSETQKPGYAIYNAPGCPTLEPAGTPTSYIAAYNATGNSYSIAVVDSPVQGIYSQKTYLLGSNLTAIDSFVIDNRENTAVNLASPNLSLPFSINCKPNPFKGNVDISTNGVKSTIEVFDLRGRVVARAVEADRLNFNGATNNNGFYFIKASNGNRVVSKRICLIK